MFDLQNLSLEELRSIEEDVKVEITAREKFRQMELVEAVCKTVNQLKREFPRTELRMSFECPECALDEDFDVLDYFCGGREMNPNDFDIW